MPTKNSRKQYLSEQYYHVYSRGINKEALFREPADYEFFISLLKRYLSKKPVLSKARVLYPSFSNAVDLNAYCLMTNHIHLLIYQNQDVGIKKLMQSVMTSYSMYFNQKYKHFGPVFQGRYLARHIDNDAYLHHISRYIHLNPRRYLDYPYSSLQYYLGSKNADWLVTKSITGMFNNSADYLEFLEDHRGHMDMLEVIKYDLADQ